MDAEESSLFGPERRGNELPEGLRRRTGRLKRLQEARARLEREAAQAAQEHLAQRQAEEVATGKKRWGRKPQVVEAPLLKRPRLTRLTQIAVS